VKDVDAGLLSAVMMGERRGIQKWLDRGASLHAVNKRGQTALMLCANIETFGWLISAGVAIDARDNGGQTALFEAAVRDNPQFVRLLLERGADVNARSNWGYTALFEAATWHKPQNVRLLLDYGADVNVRVNDGSTPLMHAAWPWPQDTEAVETLSLLLSHGADVNAVDQQGKTALIHLLEDDQHDGKRETIATFPRRQAAYAEIVRLLLAYNAEIGIVDSDGNTALSFSVKRGLSDVVTLLKQQAQ
jgi:ankyrin repeat protein